MNTAAAVLDQLAARGIEAKSLCLDSRRVVPGDVFVALKGHRSDGRDYIAQAVAQGAAGVLYEAGPVAAGRAMPPITVPHVGVAGLDGLLGEIAHRVYGHPSAQLWLCGVTGTNGKTSITQWIAQAMNALNGQCAVVGTLGYGFPGALIESVNTTPDAVSLQRALATFVAAGASACAMEVSSTGIAQGRVNGLAFDTAVFTNLTRDHLEDHGSMAAYAAAKARLFDWPGLSAAVINLDDAYGAELAVRLAGRVRTIGYTLEGRGGTDQVLAAENLTMTPTGLAFTLGGFAVEAPLVGRFNAANLLAVIGALLANDNTLTDIAPVLRRLVPPAGRMQAIGATGCPLVVVDYAHTPDALDNALKTLRETATARGGKLICVFGCGGNRDTGKRPLMGEIAERLADTVVVTSDNPRSEDPQAIIAAIRSGMQGAPAIEPDRAAAIRWAVNAADERDVILLAGKGHEPYQEIAGVRLPFSDIDVTERAFEARHMQSTGEAEPC